MLFILLLFLLHNCNGIESDNHLPRLDPIKTKIWGPGIQHIPGAGISAKYFFIQPIDLEGNALTSSIVSNVNVTIVGTSINGLNKCLSHIEQLDPGDGLVLVRYKLYIICTNLEIHIKYNDEHVGESPYTFGTKRFNVDTCNCPIALPEWLKQLQCRPHESQIEADLNPFRAINFTNIRPRILEKFQAPGSYSLCNYVIKENQIYRKCYGKHTGFSMFMDAILVALVRMVQLPDTEFFINLGDWPLVKKGGQSRTHGPYPIFSWCGSNETFDIVLPTYDITESTLQNMGRVTLDMLSVQRANRAWSEKIDKAFWRGRDSRRERLNLIDIGRQNEDLLNVSLTNFFFFRNEEKLYGPKVKHISFMDFFDYKYQINIDGTVAAYRFPYLLGGNSLVLKQDSPFYEHFYSKIEPYVHYVPFKRDLSDLVDKIQWAQQNEAEVLQIIQNAQQFVREHLLPNDILCYHVLLLQSYSRNVISEINILPDMEHVPVPETSCTCDEEALHNVKASARQMDEL